MAFNTDTGTNALSFLLHGRCYEENSNTTDNIFESVQINTTQYNVEDTCGELCASSEPSSNNNESISPVLNKDVTPIRQQTQDAENAKNDIYVCNSFTVKLDGRDLNDIPARYEVPALQSYEYAVIGIWIDNRVTPGFKYKVRPICSTEISEKFLFGGNALELQSIGRGYSRRITFVPEMGMLNDNPNYFWADSMPFGFAFQLEVVSVKEQYSIYGVDNHPVGYLKIVKLQSPQDEVRYTVNENKCVEKIVQLSFLAEVEWYYKKEVSMVSVSGTAICVRERSKSAKVTCIMGVTIGANSNKTYTLTPGVDNKKRCIFVSGKVCYDVPINYAITGLETYELPVIGTYLDPRIVPGFYYKVRPVISTNHLFDGHILRLVSIGIGYGKRITFSPDKNQKNENLNYFWTDSYPGGFGFELRAVHCATNFKIYAKNQTIGHASVFRVDKPQHEQKQVLVKECTGTTIMKYVHVDMTCCISLNITGNKCSVQNGACCHGEIMRISGTAVLSKQPNKKEAVLLRVENIGLDSQINLLFQNSDILFLPE